MTEKETTRTPFHTVLQGGEQLDFLAQPSRVDGVSLRRAPVKE